MTSKDPELQRVVTTGKFGTNLDGAFAKGQSLGRFIDSLDIIVLQIILMNLFRLPDRFKWRLNIAEQTKSQIMSHLGCWI